MMEFWEQEPPEPRVQKSPAELPRPKQPAPDKITPVPSVTPGTAEEVKGFLQLRRESLIQGVIWAEILGKPKAKRGRR